MPFPTSPWTRIATLSDGREREVVLREFCELYSGPIYAFVSSKYPDLDSQDLTQEVLAYVLSKDLLDKADRERGRLRTYLIQIIKGVASKSWRAQAKRAELPALDLDECQAFTAGLKHEKTSPGDSLDVLLARQIFRRCLDRLRRRYAEQGRSKAFEVLLERCLDDEIRDGAKKLGISNEAMRVQLHRFRKRLKEAFDAEVQRSVVDPDTVAEERDYLLGLLSEHGTS